MPKQNAKEAAVVDGLDVYGVDNIKEVIDFFNDGKPLEKILEKFPIKKVIFALQKGNHTLMNCTDNIIPGPDDPRAQNNFEEMEDELVIPGAIADYVTNADNNKINVKKETKTANTLGILTLKNCCIDK